MLGGWIGEFGPRAPFFAAAAICGLNFLYGLVVLPETLAAEKRRPFDIKRSNFVGSIRSLGRISGVRGLILVFFGLALAHTVYPSTYTLSTMEALDWSSADVGNSLGAFGLAQLFVQGYLIRIIVPKIGMYYAGVIGMAGAVVAYATLGVADAGWIVYAAGPFAALAGLYGPALTNMMSVRVSESEQGELQGAIGAAQGLAMMIGPLVLTWIFYLFADRDSTVIYLPGAPFLVAAVLALLSLTLYFAVTSARDRAVQAPAE